MPQPASLPENLPAPFDEAFLRDCPYDPSVLFCDQLISIDAEKSQVVCRIPTSDAMPFTDKQRAHPKRHPRHVAGAVMVHASGMLGFVHAYYLLGLRHEDGWIGYGTHLHKVVFRKLVPPGEPIIATCTATRTRLLQGRYFVRYSFDYRHEGDLCYEGDQTAVWMNALTDAGALVEGAAEGA